MPGCSPSGWRDCAGSSLDLATVQSNIVIFRMEEGAPDAATIVARAQETGVLVSAFGERTVRAVTHLDVSREQCRRAADLLAAGHREPLAGLLGARREEDEGADFEALARRGVGRRGRVVEAGMGGKPRRALGEPS